MAERIFTIPINEAFDEKCGCPLCRMHDKLEEQTVDAALGAAMMEPAVRIEMNRESFCREHLQAMYRKKNKLALGLILESRLDELAVMLDQPAAGGKKGFFSKKEGKGDAAETLQERMAGREKSNPIQGRAITAVKSTQDAQEVLTK